MESLALMVAIIVAPAMFGGPIALLLSLWRPAQISTLRRTMILLLGLSSGFIGIYLIFGNISKGATLVGILGIVTGILAVWRTRKKRSNED